MTVVILLPALPICCLWEMLKAGTSEEVNLRGCSQMPLPRCCPPTPASEVHTDSGSGQLVTDSPSQRHLLGPIARTVPVFTAKPLSLIQEITAATCDVSPAGQADTGRPHLKPRVHS